MTTKRQMAKAARLWSLAVIAQMDGGEGEEGMVLRKVAADKAVDTLWSLGYGRGELLSEGDCINAVKGNY